MDGEVRVRIRIFGVPDLVSPGFEISAFEFKPPNAADGTGSRRRRLSQGGGSDILLPESVDPTTGVIPVFVHCLDRSRRLDRQRARNLGLLGAAMESGPGLPNVSLAASCSSGSPEPISHALFERDRGWPRPVTPVPEPSMLAFWVLASRRWLERSKNRPSQEHRCDFRSPFRHSRPSDDAFRSISELARRRRGSTEDAPELPSNQYVGPSR